MIKNCTIDLKKEISEKSFFVPDKKIIEILFDSVKSSRPRRCKIVNENEILVRNYFMDSNEDWYKLDYIMLNINLWNLILNARISILTDAEKETKTIVYSLDLILSVIAFISIIVVFGFVSVFGIYKGSGSIIYGLKVGGGFVLLWTLFNVLSLFFQISRHKKIIKSSINKIKTFANNVYKK